MSALITQPRLTYTSIHIFDHGRILFLLQRIGLPSDIFHYKSALLPPTHKSSGQENHFPASSHTPIMADGMT